MKNKVKILQLEINNTCDYLQQNRVELTLENIHKHLGKGHYLDLVKMVTLYKTDIEKALKIAKKENSAEIEKVYKNDEKEELTQNIIKCFDALGVTDTVLMQATIGNIFGKVDIYIKNQIQESVKDLKSKNVSDIEKIKNLESNLYLFQHKYNDLKPRFTRLEQKLSYVEKQLKIDKETTKDYLKENRSSNSSKILSTISSTHLLQLSRLKKYSGVPRIVYNESLKKIVVSTGVGATSSRFKNELKNAEEGFFQVKSSYCKNEQCYTLSAISENILQRLLDRRWKSVYSDDIKQVWIKITTNIKL